MAARYTHGDPGKLVTPLGYNRWRCVCLRLGATCAAARHCRRKADCCAFNDARRVA
jgi:hypothetical protein